MSRVGGKKALRDEVVSRFPIGFERYIEVFGGAAWILFHKTPSHFEVYNDFDGELVTLFRVVREKPRELIDALRLVLNARADFELVRDTLKSKEVADEVRRAAMFFQLVKQSYASDCDSFACQPNDVSRSFPAILQAHRRLRSVVIENRDFEKLIGQYDRPVSFFYCDPPYFGTEGYYTGFAPADHRRLHDCLMRIEGKFLLSYNDCAFIRELYSEPRLHIESVSRLDNIKQRFDAGAQYAELLIANYDMTERQRLLPKQLCFTDFSNERIF
ncbi:MAG: DNA adenine methylase [Oscillospiraceae bacterium]|nr:DNA adenine methylase [Oscillospiraceae bacterium]